LVANECLLVKSYAELHNNVDNLSTVLINNVLVSMNDRACNRHSVNGEKVFEMFDAYQFPRHVLYKEAYPAIKFSYAKLPFDRVKISAYGRTVYAYDGMHVSLLGTDETLRMFGQVEFLDAGDSQIFSKIWSTHLNGVRLATFDSWLNYDTELYAFRNEYFQKTVLYCTTGDYIAFDEEHARMYATLRLQREELNEYVFRKAFDYALIEDKFSYTEIFHLGNLKLRCGAFAQFGKVIKKEPITSHNYCKILHQPLLKYKLRHNNGFLTIKEDVRLTNVDKIKRALGEVRKVVTPAMLMTTEDFGAMALVTESAK